MILHLCGLSFMLLFTAKKINVIYDVIQQRLRVSRDNLHHNQINNGVR